MAQATEFVYHIPLSQSVERSPRRRARRRRLWHSRPRKPRCKALKDEFKHRGLLTATGEHFTVTAPIRFRPARCRGRQAILGDAWRSSRRRASPRSSASRPPSV